VNIIQAILHWMLYEDYSIFVFFKIIRI
jgi:hypothetical protein